MGSEDIRSMLQEALGQKYSVVEAKMIYRDQSDLYLCLFKISHGGAAPDTAACEFKPSEDINAAMVKLAGRIDALKNGVSSWAV